MRTVLVALVASLIALGAASERDSANTKTAEPDSVSIAAGAKLYKQYCMPCHGKTGTGDGPTGAALKPKPRNFQNPKELKSKNDDELFNVIRNGGASVGLSPLMVAWKGTLKDPQIRQLVAYVRTLIRAGSESKKPAGENPDKKKKKEKSER